MLLPHKADSLNGLGDQRPAASSTPPYESHAESSCIQIVLKLLGFRTHYSETIQQGIRLKKMRQSPEGYSREPTAMEPSER